MATKLEIDENQFNQIRFLYLSDKLSTKEIAKKINISTTVICNILKEYGLYVNTNDINKENIEKKGDLKKRTNEIKDELIKKEVFFKKSENLINDKKFIAVCKITGKEFFDYKNSSGILTEHLNELFPGFKHPSNFLKREYKKKTGTYWHEQYFYIIESTKEEKKLLKCSYCDWTVSDIENKSGWYTTHLKNEHGILDISKHIETHQEEKSLFKNILLNENKKKHVLLDIENYVTCKICGEKLGIISNSHLKKHGITQSDYKIKYSTELIASNDFIKKTTINLKEASKNIQHSFVSAAESDILLFLKKESKNLILQGSNRKLLHGVEIDILCEDKKIGIEFNGNMFHSEVFGKKGTNFHLNKTNLMNNSGYSLIHIFEDEWEVKQEIVKSKLKHIFGLNNDLPKIYARKCEIKQISDYEKNVFLNKNHIQGEDRSTISFGAFYNNKLIAVMSFDSKRSMNKRIVNDGSYELKRFATDINYIIVGAAGKLLSHFIENYNPKNIISFADRRWTMNSENNLYTKLGFKLTNILRPDYSYYNSKIDRFRRFHKFGFGKKSIKKKFPGIYSDVKTEWEMMQEAGYDRIWDCGKFVYELQVN